MLNRTGMEPMFDMFVYETVQLIEQLEQLVLDGEKSNSLEQHINEIFRIMHTIKGSAAMMLINNISSLAHSIEDVFYFLREEEPNNVDYSKLTDIILVSIDFIKSEVEKIEDNKCSDGDSTELVDSINAFLCNLKDEGLNNKSVISKSEFVKELCENNGANNNSYRAVISFEEGCEMENIRAFALVHKLKQIANNISHFPIDITDNQDTIEIIRKKGFEIYFTSDLPEREIRGLLEETIFLRDLVLEFSDTGEIINPANTELILKEPSEEITEKLQKDNVQVDSNNNLSKQNFISVNINKMNNLMDLVGELVISEAMVTQNPDLIGLELENFKKSARQLRKIIGELQDNVMSMRMVPLSTTFQKMNRIVRDMCKKLSKEVYFEIIGEETEVDKNIIENISDPLMHLIRNAIDHGLEPIEERKLKGKSERGRVTLEAKNAGGDVWIILKDDGRGLDREKILKKAIENGITQKSASELSDKEIYSFILLPGFSTKDDVTEFSGRGVGMDVVRKNIEQVGGTIIIDSVPGYGCTVSIKIPLTLAIVDGMVIKVGNSTYIIPMTSIQQSLKVSEAQIIKDTQNNEMIMIRGECYSILRLHELYSIDNSVTSIDEGIVIIIENDEKSVCIFADELIAEQQVVVKALPHYIKKVHGLSGCTLLGDGSISLILDISSLINSTQ